MKTYPHIILVLLLIISGCVKSGSNERTLTIYTYDSFAAEWGLEPVVIPPFEDKCRCEVNVIAVGDGGAILNRLILEGEKTTADVVIGLDNNLAAKALAMDIFEEYRPRNADTVPKDIWFDKTNRLIPFDYGHFAIVYDSKTLKNPPTKLGDLLLPKFKRKLIVQDPRTSTPGLGFLLWSISIFGNNYPAFWQRLKPSVLTVTPGWDSAYAMFKKGEAPMVLSYTTSPAYHIINEKDERYKAAIFPEGHYTQIETAGIIKYSDNKSIARNFMDYLLSIQFQKEIPTKNYMYPANREAPLPEAFTTLPKPTKQLLLDGAVISKKMPKWIEEWRKAMR